MSITPRADTALKKLTAKHYGEPHETDRTKHPVAWCTAISPSEFLRAMGVLPLFPENHGAMIGAKKMGVELAEAAESRGYSTDVCSYARADFGHIFTGQSPVGGLAKPDLLVCCNNTCQTVTKWYENLSRQFQVPLVIIDTPFNHGAEITPHSVEYIKSQFLELIDVLERVTGRDWDEERFQEVVEISSETSRQWRRVLDKNTAQPAPFTAFDAFNYMAPIVTMRGTADALEFYRELNRELDEVIAAGRGAVPGERLRLMWDGIPVWFELRRMAELLYKYRANFVCSTYTDAWVLEFDPQDPLNSMAEVYSQVLINQNLDLKLADYEQQVEKYRLHGAVHHSNRSCKPACFGLYDLHQMAQRSKNPIPDLIIDGDQCDARSFSWAQFETRFQSFMETLEAQG